MKNVVAFIAMCCAVSVSPTAYAAGDMGNMNMASGAQQSADVNADANKSMSSHGEVKKVDTAAANSPSSTVPWRTLAWKP